MKRLLGLAAVIAAVSAAACGSDVSGGVFGNDGSGGSGGSTTTTGTGASTSSGSTTDATSTSTSASTTASSAAGTGGGGPIVCSPGTADCDGDAANGCETDILTDPVACGGCGMPCASTCQGGKCQPAMTCDDGAFGVDDADPLHAAAAIGLCKVDSASWILADGSPAPNQPSYHAGHGILSDFGPNVHPQQGTRLLALSSGYGRRPTDPGYVQGYDKGISSNAPAGFPKAFPSCGGNVATGTPHDSAALEVHVKAPKAASGFSFKLKFYTFEWAAFACSQYADVFFATLSPAPAAAADGIIVLDPQSELLAPGTSFIDVCGCMNGPPCVVGMKTFACTHGQAELTGTGFEDHGASAWLETTSPVNGGDDVVVRFITFDSADGVLDTTALVDDFQWLTAPNVPVETSPVANPK